MNILILRVFCFNHVRYSCKMSFVLRKIMYFFSIFLEVYFKRFIGYNCREKQNFGVLFLSSYFHSRETNVLHVFKLIHHKLSISQNFNKICAKIVKQYVCVNSVGFKV